MKSFYEIGIEVGTDKATHHRYDRYYPLYLEPLRNKSFNMLEIGIDKSASLNLWKRYFPQAYIYGIDIGVEYEDERSKVFKLDQSNKKDLQFTLDNIPKCDFIIDDGSHNPYHQFLTFTTLYPTLLNKGGIYIIEDIEVNYWKHNTTLFGYPRGDFNLIDLLKQYPDKINKEFSRVHDNLNMSSILFGQNCVIIKKATEEEELLLNRNYRFNH